MFEKEAEEYLDTESKYLIEDNEGNIINITKKVKQSFKDGAEFGYNKANEWHKVAEGDLPKHTRYVWTNVGPSYYDDDRDCPCWRDEFGRTQGVIAWCEPKFKE